MIKQSGGKLCDNQGAGRHGLSQGSQLRGKGCTTMLTSREVTVAVTIHDKTSELWKKGAGGRKLRDAV